jgi:hypothetical protein
MYNKYNLQNGRKYLVVVIHLIRSNILNKTCNSKITLTSLGVWLKQ